MLGIVKLIYRHIFYLSIRLEFLSQDIHECIPSTL